MVIEQGVQILGQSLQDLIRIYISYLTFGIDIAAGIVTLVRVTRQAQGILGMMNLLSDTFAKLIGMTMGAISPRVQVGLVC